MKITIKKNLFSIILGFLVFIILELTIKFTVLNGNTPKIEHEVFFRKYWLKNQATQVPNTYYQYNATLGWDNRPGVVDYGEVNVEINSKGVRSKREYTYERTPGKKRILFIGDSHAFGEDNNNDSITSYYLENSLKNTEFINLGVGGYGHDQMLLKLKKEIVKYKPDLIVLLYMDGDDIRNSMKFRDYAKPKFKIKDETLILTNTPVPTTNSIIKSEKYHSYTWDFIKFLFDQLGDSEKNITRLTVKIIQEMNKTAVNNSADFIIVSLDQSKIDNIFKNESIKVWNFKYNKKDQKKFEGHWNKEGHNLMSQFIKNSLLGLGFD